MAGSTTHGIRYAAFGIIDDNGNILKDSKGVNNLGVYVVDDKGEGATTANITGLEQAGTIKYANNQAKRIIHGKQQPQVALTMLDMPRELLNKLKGYISDGKGGYVLSSGAKPNVALLLCSEDMDGTLIYEGFAHGELTQTGQNHGTDTNQLVEADVTLTYQALDPLKETIFLDNRGVQQPYKVWADDETGFDMVEMYKEVFGGFTEVQSLKIPKKIKANTGAAVSTSPSVVG